MWTQSSTASILSGTPYGKHGVGDTNEVLPAELSTIPELLRKVGYKTYSLSRAPNTGAGIGVDRGFDRFEDRFTEETKVKSI
jgi:arylsulfatase A-like enzyme